MTTRVNSKLGRQKIPKLYVPNNKAPKYRKQKLTEL